MEFHVSSFSRKRYDFDKKIFSYNGNVIFADFRAAREFAEKINQVRTHEGIHETMSPALLNALGLIDEIMHAVVDQYGKKINTDLNSEAFEFIQSKIDADDFTRSLEEFCSEFPPSDVYQNKMTVQEFLSATNPKGKKNQHETLEEILMLWITNRNPAAMKLCGELFDEKSLAENSAYSKIIFYLSEYYKTLPPINGKNLIDYLREPALAHPDSLFDQLDFIRLNWASFLGDFLRRMLLGLDWMKEDAKAHFMGPGPVEIPVYGEGSNDEFESFTQDREWMPRLVLMAKNTYVWMYQLSKKYGYQITKLNEIPDEELKNLSDEGFTGLWLIGLWERSKASARIKQLCGNPEAIASAYSLADYRIADDLGGEQAFQELKRKAWHYGIRLASDMVPNHMGIDSNWVLYNPDRFLSLPYKPFPTYTFNGPNLSPDPHIGVFLEDHYYNRQDASVVFQRVDYSNGDVRYIYHGNDGTSMPWNDTAQLNYLNPEVREQVIQTILQVAKRFPIIRFDAAMTLAKKQYQRLWFPEPGSGGDIATRAEHGMTKADFDKAFPVEFWREVVDRIQKEAPDTLLLAEAFWMMESYFVRTLGMHRVYNSAFMNLLRDEDNKRYRILLKNTLEFDPEILKRYVNFMNNPDERTAVDQFGKGDKYFGICVLMATMPGLPMFGHGQLEGFSEKYGMEFKKSYQDEHIDQDLFRRHQREIFPLLHMRRRFAEVKDFVLYNFANDYGNVDENVYAYSNYGEGRHTLVVYNNRYSETSGFIKQSVPFIIKNGQTKTTISRQLSEALCVHDDSNCFVIMHETITGLNYVRSSKEICQRGLFFKLHAYQYYVFDEIYEVQDDSQGTWRKLCDYLKGNGTADISDSIQELTLHFVLDPFRNCFEGHKLRWLSEKIGFNPDKPQWDEVMNGTWIDFNKLAAAFNDFYHLDRSLDGLFSVYSSGIREMLHTPKENIVPGLTSANSEIQKAQEILENRPDLWMFLLVSLQEQLLVRYNQPDQIECRSYNIADDWHLKKSLVRIIHDAGWFNIAVDDQIAIIQWLYEHLDRIDNWQIDTIDLNLDAFLLEGSTQEILKVNTYNGIQWFNLEMSQALSKLLRLSGYYLTAFDSGASADRKAENIRKMNLAADILDERIEKSEYHFEKLIKSDEQTISENADKENSESKPSEPDKNSSEKNPEKAEGKDTKDTPD